MFVFEHGPDDEVQPAGVYVDPLNRGQEQPVERLETYLRNRHEQEELLSRPQGLACLETEV